MYLHIGGDCVLLLSDIVGIFDMDNTSISKITRGFLQQAEKSRLTETVSAELPKSYVVTRTKVYISPISPATLEKRANLSADFSL